MVKQLSVFVENKHGRIMEILTTLANNKVDIKALSVADATDFGVIRMIVSDVEVAKKALKDDGVIVRISDVMAVAVEDKPGALLNTFSILCDNGVAIEYMYAFAVKLGDSSIIAIHTDMPVKSVELLKAGGVHVLENSEVEAL